MRSLIRMRHLLEIRIIIIELDVSLRRFVDKCRNRFFLWVRVNYWLWWECLVERLLVLISISVMKILILVFRLAGRITLHLHILVHLIRLLIWRKLLLILALMKLSFLIPALKLRVSKLLRLIALKLIVLLKTSHTTMHLLLIMLLWLWFLFVLKLVSSHLVVIITWSLYLHILARILLLFATKTLWFVTSKESLRLRLLI